MTLAVLTIAHGRHDHLRAQIAGLAAGERVPDLHVVAALDDPQIATLARCAWDSVRHTERAPDLAVVDVPGDPRGLPLARGRNLAAQAASDAGAGRLVLLDVDCIPAGTTLRAYDEALTADGPRHGRPAPAVLCGDVAYLPPLGPGDPPWHEPAGLARMAEVGAHRPDRVRLAPGESLAERDLTRFWSLSFALTAEDFASTGGFCEDYVGYGGEDTDFAQQLGSCGGSLTWIGGATSYHQHHDSQSPPVRHLAAIVRNAGVFADRWGWWPMLGWLEAFRELGLAAPDAQGRWRVLDAEEER